MAALSLSLDAIRPLNRWNNTSIRPGNVGSVGDVLIAERLKASLPGEFRWDSLTSGENEPTYGSNISDGMFTGYTSGGGPGRTIDSNWGSRRRFETSHGWRIQDLRPEDRRIEPTVGAMPQYTWRNRIATLEQARTTGDLFPIPAGGVLQGPAGIMRGGNNPRVTDIVAEEPVTGTLPSMVNHHPTSDFGNSGPRSVDRRQQSEGKKNGLGKPFRR